MSRLSTVDYGDGQTQGYSFDAMGNRAQRVDSVAGTTTYGYDAANRLTTLNGNATAYTNDADGNTLSGGGRTNTWDAQNRLVQSVVSGTRCAYTYGADGLRRSQTVTPAGGGTATTTYFVYDGSMLVREMQRKAQGVEGGCLRWDSPNDCPSGTCPLSHIPRVPTSPAPGVPAVTLTKGPDPCYNSLSHCRETRWGTVSELVEGARLEIV